MPLTDAEEYELLTLEREQAMATKPKRQFNTIAEASAAMRQANANQSIAQRNVENIDPLVSLGRSAYNLSWPISALANKVINKGSPVPEATTSGGRLMQDMSAIANPLVGRAVGYGAEKVGQAVGATSKFIGSTYRKATNLIKLDKYLPSANKLQSAIDKLNINKVDVKGLQEASDITTQSDISKVSEVLQSDKNIFKKSLNDITTAFNQSKKDFNNIISEKTGQVAKNVKQPVITFFRNASKAYGETRDAIFNAIDDPIQAQSLLKKNASPVTRTEFLDEANSVLKEFGDQPDIVNSKSYKGLVDLINKYSPEGADTGLVDASGKAIKQALPESLDIKQLIGDLKDYNKVFSSSFESGSKALSPDELVAARFNYNMGNIIKERIPKFAELQKSYKPVIDNKKLAYTIFKPGNEVSSSSAQALFKRVASGKSTQQDKDLLSFIQKGTKVGDKEVSGIGDFTKELNKIADDIAKSGKRFGLKSKALKAKNELDIQTLKEVSKTILEKNKLNKLSTIEDIRKIDSRLSRLTDILRRRKDVDEIKKSFAQKAVVWTVGAGVGALISKINK